MVLYGITLVTLVADLQEEDPGILTRFYAEKGLARRSSQLPKLILERGPNLGVLTQARQVPTYSRLA